MSRIGGGGNKPPIDPKQARSSDAQPSSEGNKGQKASGEKALVDKFTSTPQLRSQLQSMAGKRAAQPSLVFTNEMLESVAKTFAAYLRKNPGADRKKRARMFAKSILKHKKFGTIFDDEEDSEELEQLYDEIAEQLDGSPRFAQLVDEVTEGARKIM